MGDGVINGGIDARFIEFSKPSFLGRPQKCRGGINVQVWPPGESFSSDLLMGRKIEDGLVLRCEITPVEQLIERESRHL
jgi:hypothetical protein